MARRPSSMDIFTTVRGERAIVRTADSAYVGTFDGFRNVETGGCVVFMKHLTDKFTLDRKGVPHFFREEKHVPAVHGATVGIIVDHSSEFFTGETAEREALQMKVEAYFKARLRLRAVGKVTTPITGMCRDGQRL